MSDPKGEAGNVHYVDFRASGPARPAAPNVAAEPSKPKRTPKEIASILQAEIAKIKAENERLRDERNSRRWRAQRDPLEYEAQKVRQRVDYAAMIAETEGREVRPYERIQGATPAERQAARKERQRQQDAARKKAARANQTPEQVAARKAKDAERKRQKRAEAKAAKATSEAASEPESFM